jgi:ribosomal-protein-alanine N-acetyltransferase
MLQLNLSQFPVLNSQNVHLRNITLNDAEHVFNLRCNRDAMNYIDRPIPKSIEESIEMIHQIEKGINDNKSIGWAISLNNDSKLIGTIGFHRIDLENYRAEIGYMLFPEYWRKGIMNEAIDMAIDYGFKELKFHSIEANINPNNIASRNLLLKKGFLKEAYFKENYYFNGRFLDSEIYSLLNKG